MHYPGHSDCHPYTPSHHHPVSGINYIGVSVIISPQELLVHHQKIKADLEDVYRRTAALHSNDMTMEERIEDVYRRWLRYRGLGHFRRREGTPSQNLLVVGHLLSLPSFPLCLFEKVCSLIIPSAFKPFKLKRNGKLIPTKIVRLR
jgi:hypothetical protein